MGREAGDGAREAGDGAGLELEELPGLMDSLVLSDVPTGAALGALLSPVPGSPGVASRRALPSLDLGIKASFTMRQWREAERRTHLKVVHSIQSPLKAEVEAHQRGLDRNKAILSYGETNKAQALELQLSKVKRENAELSRRLLKIQQTETEITETNLPGKRHQVKAAAERAKYLRTARRVAQIRLDFENSLILKRLANARPTVKPREQCDLDYKRHRRIRRNMCKLTVPPEEYERYFAERGGLSSAADSGGALDGGGSGFAGLAGPTGPGPLSRRRRKPETPAERGQRRPRLPPPLSPLLAVCNSEPWLQRAAGRQQQEQGEPRGPESSVGALPLLQQGDFVRPISRAAAEERIALPEIPASTRPPGARAATTREGATRIKSSEDRGQVCHEWVLLRHVRPGEQPQQVRALLIGFKKPRKPNEEEDEEEAAKLIFEVSCGEATRYAQVSYDQLKQALALQAQSGAQKSLAQVAADRLTLFGQDDLVLIWNDV
jgi:hypothetical protein